MFVDRNVVCRKGRGEGIYSALPVKPYPSGMACTPSMPAIVVITVTTTFRMVFQVSFVIFMMFSFYSLLIWGVSTQPSRVALQCTTM